MKLAAKLALGLMAATALVFGVFGWQLRLAQQRNAEQMVTVTAERICDIIRGSTRYQMLHNDREALYRTIRDIGSEAGIRQIRIFSKTGQISFSTNDAEANTVVDKRAEACYACHAQAAPLEKLDRDDRARIFTTNEGERVLAVILPIENQRDCWSAACHVHPERQKVLGVIDAHLSLAAVDRQIAEQQNLLARFTLAASAFFGLLSLGFIWIMVYRPLRDLVCGIRKVARGEMSSQEIPVRSHDEIGEVATEFNHMTKELDAAHQEITAWTRTLEDRVERKSRELERAHHGLLHSEKLASVGKLAATVAHEINNPLFGILTNARLAKRQAERANLDPEQRAKLDAKLAIIERESQRCGEIVKNLLAFSRQSKPQLETVTLSTVIEHAVALIRHGYELQNIQLNVNATQQALVRGDAGQLQQVLLVLLVNAGDAMKEGGAVSITCDVAGSQVQLRVQDNGPGIPDDIRERIFEPFFSTKEDGHGTGLGLAIAQGIVEQHQGTIQVTSQVGKGTEFLIQLPLAMMPESVPT